LLAKLNLDLPDIIAGSMNFFLLPVIVLWKRECPLLYLTKFFEGAFIL